MAETVNLIPNFKTFENGVWEYRMVLHDSSGEKIVDRVWTEIGPSPIMPKSPLDALHLTEAQKTMLVHLGEARKQLQREKTPRCLECVRAIDDVAKEFTGDGEFFHTHGHRIP